MSITDGYFSLDSTVNRVNKVRDDKEGVAGQLLPELTLTIEDDELLKLKDEWKRNWDDYFKKYEPKGKKNENYWKGQFDYSELEAKSDDKPEADNLIFESLETFLPMATRQNPEANAKCDDDQQAQFTEDFLSDLSDTLKFKLKLREVTRHWALYFSGVAKIVWNVQDNRIDLRPIKVKKLILDPDAYIEGGIYHGEYIGEYKTEKASVVIKKFPNKKAEILAKTENKLATKVTYIEWWTDEYVFWTMDKDVLDKQKNPHWNYQETKPVTDEYGVQTEQTTEGSNFLPYPQMPYAFLAVFNTGDHPLDDTGLISQNLFLQDMIHKRLKQIDVNTDNINGGYVVSGEYTGLTEEQAAQAVQAIRQGGAVYVPQGQAESAVAKINGTGLSQDVYQSLVDYRNELRNIFGTRGSTAAGIQQEQTVRGKIMSRGTDDSRIGLISEYLEQFSDYVYNWFIQMAFVYMPEVSQQMKAPMTISVKEGSLIPKDSLTKRNEAIDLWNAGAVAPIDLYKALETPNPEEMVQDLMDWKTFEATPVQPAMPQGQPAPQEQPQDASAQLLNSVPIQ